MATIPFFRGSTGLNTVVDPVRLGYDSETGVQALAEAVNVWVDDTGRIAAVPGYVSLVALAGADNLFAHGARLLCTAGTGLYLFDEELRGALIFDGLTSTAPMSYAPFFDRIVYMNGQDSGVVNADGSRTPMDFDDYIGPKTSRYMSPTPVGQIVRAYNGRLYVAAGSALWFSEIGAPGWVDASSNVLPFAGEIVMVEPVDDGLWVATRSETVFLAGRTADSLAPLVRVPYGAIPGAALVIPGDLIGDGELAGKRVVIFDTPNGRCFGGPGGYFSNRTQDTLVMPKASRGVMASTNGRVASLYL